VSFIILVAKGYVGRDEVVDSVNRYHSDA